MARRAPSRRVFALFLLTWCSIIGLVCSAVDGDEGDDYEVIFDSPEVFPEVPLPLARQAVVDPVEVYPTLFATISVPGIKPRAFRDKSLNYSAEFVEFFRGGLPGGPVVRIHGLQGEDTGTGAEAEIEASGYVHVETITQHHGMRAQVIDDITRRMRMLASELKMWKLTSDERADLFVRLAEAMTDARDEAA